MIKRMCNVLWLVLFASIIHFNNVKSKFVDVDPHQIDVDIVTRDITLKDNEILGTPFETSQYEVRYKTQQKYKGIPIFGATLVVEQDQTNPKRTVPIEGKWYDKTDIEKLVPTIKPAFSEDKAFEIALESININSDHVYSQSTAKLYIYYHHSFPYLCWIVKFSYYKNKEIHHPMVIINALNGDILQTYDESYNVAIEACGIGGNTKTGLSSICELINGNINPVLENDVIQIYENHGNSWTDHSQATKITCSNLQQPLNNSFYPQCDIDDVYTNGANCPACDLYLFANVVFEMFDAWTNATYPISPAFVPMKLYIHVGSGWANANYEFATGTMNFGDGNLDWFPLTTLDITSHEIAHGYTDQGSDLIYSGESGGMNEAFSDIAGEAAKYWFEGSNDWLLGGSMVKASGEALRYMYDPPFDGSSIDHYSDYYGQNVHYTSGLYNKAAYNLNTNENWSMEEIFRVFAWANLFYWTSDSTFNEGVSGLHRALYDLYDDNNTDVESMANGLDSAFSDVGLFKINSTIPDGLLCQVSGRFCYKIGVNKIIFQQIIIINSQHINKNIIMVKNTSKKILKY